MRLNYIKRKKISRVSSVVLIFATVIAMALGVSTITKKMKDETKVIHPTFEIGGINAEGKANKAKDSIVTVESFLCKGLEVNLDFDATIKYQVFYYDVLNKYIESSPVYFEKAEMNIPINAFYARIVVTPIWNNSIKEKDRVCDWYDVLKYSSQLEIKVSKDQESQPTNISIAKFVNGTVTANRNDYKIGDTVTLIVKPEEGYAQKLYINGQPLMLDWNTFTYSFIATETVYEITGSFEKALDVMARDYCRWNHNNQAHGVFTAYYPQRTDSWWLIINGEYKSLEITAKNYLPVANSMDENGNEGYQQLISFKLSNGKDYAFRIYNDKGDYAVSCTAVSGSVTGWGNWKELNEADSLAMNRDGVQFKVERSSANTFTISVNGVEMFTYTMDGVTDADKVVSVSIQSNGNSGEYVAIPFELK